MTRKVSLEVELTEEQQRAIAWWMGDVGPEEVMGRIVRDQLIAPWTGIANTFSNARTPVLPPTDSLVRSYRRFSSPHAPAGALVYQLPQ